MSVPSAKLVVSVSDHLVVVKISGRANFNSSIDFKSLLNQLWGRGHRQFALDLAECLIMDSTFLGVLAGHGLKFAQSGEARSPCPIALINPNQRIADLLDNLGVSHLFKVIHQKDAAPAKFESVPSDPANASREEVSRTCLEAHQILMAINPANIPKFKDVAQFLAEDLKKLEGGKS